MPRLGGGDVEKFEAQRKTSESPVLLAIDATCGVTANTHVQQSSTQTPQRYGNKGKTELCACHFPPATQRPSQVGVQRTRVPHRPAQNTAAFLPRTESHRRHRSGLTRAHYLYAKRPLFCQERSCQVCLILDLVDRSPCDPTHLRPGCVVLASPKRQKLAVSTPDCCMMVSTLRPMK